MVGELRVCRWVVGPSVLVGCQQGQQVNRSSNHRGDDMLTDSPTTTFSPISPASTSRGTSGLRAVHDFGFNQQLLATKTKNLFFLGSKIPRSQVDES
jgi:hypothetical protein